VCPVGFPCFYKYCFVQYDFCVFINAVLLLIGNIENETGFDESLVYISDNTVFKNTGLILDNTEVIKTKKSYWTIQ
jgi:hypothetical protein